MIALTKGWATYADLGDSGECIKCVEGVLVHQL